MPNNLNLDLSHLRTAEFAAEFAENNQIVNRDTANAILNSNGKISLDDNGSLVVINPPAKRDNSFVRFFKGLNNASYKQEQRVLDRMEVLAKNADFNRILTKSLLSHASYESSHANIDQNSASDFALRVLDGLGKSRQAVNPQELSNHISGTAKTFALNFSSVANNRLVDNDQCPKITYGGKLYTPYEFVTTAVPSNNQAQLPGKESLVAALVQHCAFAPEDMQQYMSAEDCERMRALISNPAVRGEQRHELEQLATKAVNHVMTELSIFAKGALEQGCSAQGVADAVGEALQAFANQNPGGLQHALYDLDNPQSLVSKLNNLPITGETSVIAPDVRAQLDTVKARFAGLNDEQAANLNYFLERRHLSLDKYERYLNGFSSTLNALKDYVADGGNKYLPLHNIYNAFDQDAKAYGRELGTDDLIIISQVGAFHELLVDPQSDNLQKVLVSGPKLKNQLDYILNNFGTDPDLRMIDIETTMSTLATIDVLVGSITQEVALTKIGDQGNIYQTGKPALNDIIKNALLLETQGNRVQSLIEQRTSGFPADVRENVNKLLTHAVGAECSSKHLALTAGRINEIVDRTLQSDDLLYLCKGGSSSISSQFESKLREYFSNSDSIGSISSLLDPLNDLKNYTEDHLHKAFEKDATRGLFSKIGNEVASSETAVNQFKSLVPAAFWPAVSTLCMQGGILFTLGNFFCVPALTDSVSEIPNSILLQNKYMGMGLYFNFPHTTELRIEGNNLFINSRTAMDISSTLFDRGKAFGSVSLSSEIKIDLSAGVNDKKYPNSISIVGFGREHP